MISCHDWWPWTKPGYITMTQRQSNNQQSGSIAAHPAPKNSKCKNPLQKFSPRFFAIKMASSSLIILQRARLSMQCITRLCWCNWRTFWMKNAVARSPRGSCSWTTMPWLTRHLQPRRNGPTWASNVLISAGERPQAACLLRSWVRIPPGAWIFVRCVCHVLSGTSLCDELITRPEESYRLCCVVVCDLETSRIGAPYIYDISSLRVNDLTLILITWRKW